MLIACDEQRANPRRGFALIVSLRVDFPHFRYGINAFARQLLLTVLGGRSFASKDGEFASRLRPLYSRCAPDGLLWPSGFLYNENPAIVAGFKRG